MTNGGEATVCDVIFPYGYSTFKKSFPLHSDAKNEKLKQII